MLAESEKADVKSLKANRSVFFANFIGSHAFSKKILNHGKKEKSANPLK
jgi:hypothetical protein